MPLFTFTHGMDKLISSHFKFINNLLSKRYKSLLIGMIAMIIVPGFFQETNYEREIAFMLNGLVVFLCIYAIQESRLQLYSGLVIAALVILYNHAGVFERSRAIDFYLSFIIYIFFYAYVAYRLLVMILKTDRVRTGVLYAAIIVYLFIGIIGGYLFMLIENITPGSLNNLLLVDITSPSKFFYFSFTTLSTLGYGEISPSSAPARSLAIILSTTGPLYLTVLVALLVSRFEHVDHDDQNESY